MKKVMALLLMLVLLSLLAAPAGRRVRFLLEGELGQLPKLQ